MADFKEGLTYPLKIEKWPRTLLVGSILIIFSFLIAPAILVYGYVIQVIRERSAGTSHPPSFGDWRTLLVDGYRAFFITGVYSIVFFMGFIVTLILFAVLYPGLDVRENTGHNFLLVGVVISAAVMQYVEFAALVNYAREKRLGAAFDFGRVKRIVLDRDYAVGALIATTILFGSFTIQAIVPLIGVIVLFYGAIVSATFVTDGFSTAVERLPWRYKYS